jgi:hypothetical protein
MEHAYSGKSASNIGTDRNVTKLGHISRCSLVSKPAQSFRPRAVTNLYFIIQFIILSFIRSSMALQPIFGLGTLLIVLILYTVGITRMISAAEGLYLHTGQHKHRRNMNRNPCLNWDLNPRSQCPNGQRLFKP